MSLNGDDTDAYVPYKDRKHWADIKPIPQNDGPHSVVRIAYRKDFIDVYDYFRAIVAKGELSERALYLTEDALNMNAANYTVWQYRRKILEHLKWDMKEELDYCRDMIESHPKNYQVWHHRRVIVQSLGDGRGEKLFTEIIFAADAKNYHAWEHRQWALKTFQDYDGELMYVDELLDEDVRNNSAWNQRYFVVNRTTGFTEEVILEEVEYTKKAIERVVNNESPWTYLTAVLQQSSKRLSEWQDIEDWCRKLYSNNNTCPHVLSFLIDLSEDHLASDTNRDSSQFLSFALKLCDELMNHHDKIRENYWNFISKTLKKKYQN